MKHTVRWDSLSSKLRSLLLRKSFDMDLTPDYLTGLKKKALLYWSAPASKEMPIGQFIRGKTPFVYAIEEKLIKHN